MRQELVNFSERFFFKVAKEGCGSFEMLREGRHIFFGDYFREHLNLFYQCGGNSFRLGVEHFYRSIEMRVLRKYSADHIHFKTVNGTRDLESFPERNFQLSQCVSKGKSMKMYEYLNNAHEPIMFPWSHSHHMRALARKPATNFFPRLCIGPSRAQNNRLFSQPQRTWAKHGMQPNDLCRTFEHHPYGKRFERGAVQEELVFSYPWENLCNNVLCHMDRDGEQDDIRFFNERLIRFFSFEVADQNTKSFLFKYTPEKTSHKPLASNNSDRLSFHTFFDYIRVMLIDTHAHLHVSEFDTDREEVIARAEAAGVAIINVGFEPEGNEKAALLAALYPTMHWTAGIHPHHADLATPHNLQRIRELKKTPIGKKLVALGEMGLDYFKNHQPKELQIVAFREQLKLAISLDLPVIIHCRDAFADAFQILEEEHITRAVFHCFTGTLAEAREAWQRGYLTSFTGICTYPKTENVRAVIREAPLDRLMLETDCPFLAPQGKRGQRNEPSFLRETFTQIVELTESSAARLELQIEKNTKDFFKI